MTIRHPDEPCRAGVFSALRLCHYPHSLGCSPPKHGSLRLLQAVASDKLLPRRRASNVAASALQTEISRVWSRSATGGFGVGSTDERDTSCATRLGCRCLGWRHVLRLYGAASLGRTP